jgi:hypothetical protein
MGILYGKPLSESYHDENDRFIIPGNRTDSLIFNRIQARGAIGNGTHNGYSQMPPIATNVVDEEGVRLLSQWIDNYVNTAPVFTAGSTTRSTVNENAAPGTFLGTAVATDLDVRNGVADGSTLRFAITSGNPQQLFSIDAVSGHLRVNGALDFEKAPHHLLEVTAFDNFSPNPRMAVQALTIDVTNVVEGDATADQNRNGIFDVWEQGFGLTGSRDTDRDGSPDFFEFLAGSDPTVTDNVASRSVKAKGFVREPYAGVVYEWRARNGLTLGVDYLAQTSSNLQGWTLLLPSAYEVLTIEPDGEGFSKITVRVPTNEAHSYFRLISPFK